MLCFFDIVRCSRRAKRARQERSLFPGFLEETKSTASRCRSSFTVCFSPGSSYWGFGAAKASSCPTHPTPQEFAATKSEWIPSRTAKREVQK
jgi:hypothetical protein